MALPKLGSIVPAAKLQDPDGHVVDLGALRGKTIVLLYEDKSSGDQNADLKEALLARAKEVGHDASIVGVAVADVSAYDFWPVKGVAKNAVRAKARKLGMPIYCDWSGRFRDVFRLERNTSNIVVINPDGKVAFAAAGELQAAAKRRLLATINQEATAAR